MALHMNPSPTDLIPEAGLAAWRGMPTAVMSDELNRSCAMSAAIKPVAPGMVFAGQALTIQAMAADNAASHYALTLVWPGSVVVIDARGHVDTAMWGGILTMGAKERGAVAVVCDGAVRDVAELRESGIAVFSRGVVPNGPQKAFGGSVNAPIQCGGLAVNPGDLVVGDDDGVVVVAPHQMAGLFERCEARIKNEENIVAQLKAGRTTVEINNLPPPEELG